MDGDLYLTILKEKLQQSLKFYSLDSSDIIFQQDNNPKHICKKVQEWLKNQDFMVLKWPEQSADLNSIAHIWFYLKRKLVKYEVSPKGMLEL